MSELFRDFARGCVRLAPLWLPGFAAVLTASFLDGPSLFHSTTVGGFLTHLLFLVPASLLLGILIQSLRYASFDVVRRFVHEKEPGGDAPEAVRYALYSNLAAFVTVLFVGLTIHWWSFWWGVRLWRVFYLVLLLAVACGLVVGAMRAYHEAVKPARRTSKKKAT